MAFFGITQLGYQNPIGDNMIVNLSKRTKSQVDTEEEEKLCDSSPKLSVDGGINARAVLPPSLQEQPGPLKCTDTCNVYHQPIAYSTGIHQGSHERYKKMVKRVQLPRSPNQLYIMPLTCNQQYGWLMSKTPEPWTQVKRFPRKNSEMTKFVEEMSVKDRVFSLF